MRRGQRDASTAVIAESKIPALYTAADQNSLNGRRRFLNVTQMWLAMLSSQ